MVHPVRLEMINGALPVAFLLGTAVVLALHGLLRPRASAHFHRWLAIEGALAALAATFVEAYRTRFLTAGLFVTTGGRNSLAPGSLTIDRYSLFATAVLAVAAIFGSALSPTAVSRFVRHSGAYQAMLLTAAAGAMLLADEHEMVTLVIGLTLLLVPLLGLAALNKPDAASLSGAHGMAIGAGVALALIGYGLALLYGITGSTDLAAVGAVTRAPVLSALGVGLVLAGLLALAGVMPSGGWLADLGEGLDGAQLAAIAGIGIPGVLLGTLRLVATALPSVAWWPSLVAALGLTTALIAGLRALAATRVRAVMLQTITGQIGLLVTVMAAVGGHFSALPSGGADAVLIGIVSIGLALIAGLAALGVLEAANGRKPLSLVDVRGLVTRLGPLGGFIVLAVLGMTSLPPLGAFISEVLGLTSLMTAGLVWATVIGLLLMVLLSIAPLRLAAAALAAPAQAAPDLSSTLGAETRSVLALCCVSGAITLLFAGTVAALAASAAAVLGVG